MANNMSPFADIFRQAIQGQPDTSKDILSFLSNSPVPDHLDAGIQGQAARDVQSLRNQGEIGKVQAEGENKRLNNKAIMDMMFGSQGNAPQGAATSQPPVSPPQGIPTPDTSNLTFIDHEGKEYKGSQAQDKMAGTIVDGDLHNSRAQASSGDPAAVQSYANKLQTVDSHAASGMKPKVSMDSEGNLRLGFEENKAAAPIDEKTMLETTKVKREVGGDIDYNTSQFPGYTPIAGQAQGKISERFLPRLKTQIGATDNAVENISQLINELNRGGIPANDWSPQGKKIKQYYNNAITSAMQASGGGEEKEDGSIVPGSNARQKYISGVLPNPSGYYARYQGKDEIIRQLRRAQDIIRGDMDSTLKAFNYEPDKAVVKDRDGTLYSIRKSDKNGALDYLNGKALDRPSSMIKVRGGATDKVPNSRVPITDRQGNVLGTTSATSLEKDKAALRAQGHDIL